MFNLLRASQVLFPEEKLLEDAKKFSVEFLRGKQANNQLFDKWIITKDLPGEVNFKFIVLHIYLVKIGHLKEAYIWRHMHI